MAKLKGSNPADAFRKAQRAKELKKNKENRKAARESQTVKRDTRDLEDEIRAIKSNPKGDKARLADLESELKYVIKTKEAYVKLHPEARDRVFKVHAPRSSAASSSTQEDDPMSHLYDDQGRLRDPTRSVYYDKVYNPFGVPPPGMPYLEREISAGSEDDDEDEEDSDDEIVMPEGPAPQGHDDDDSDDSDDIPLPSGPPPPRTLPGAMPKAPPSGPAEMLPPIYMTGRPGSGPPGSMPFAPPLSGHAGPSRRPPRPAPSVQDPLSDGPTQTYQGYRMGNNAELPPRPESESSSAAAVAPPPLRKPMPEGAGTISAEPQLRDLRKEATAFVPRGVKRKSGPASGGGKIGGALGPGRINAAPGAGIVDEDGDEVKYAAPQNGGGGLMGVLKGVLDRPAAQGASARKPEEVEDDYQKFLDGLNDLT